MKQEKKLIFILLGIIISLISIIATFLILNYFNIFSLLIYRINNYFGKSPLCNMRPDRAFKIGNFVLPLCARCTGVVIGSFINALICMIYNKRYKYMLLVSILLLIPLILDGGIQYIFGIESNNIRRLITGMLFGIGIVNIICNLMNKVMTFEK